MPMTQITHCIYTILSVMQLHIASKNWFRNLMCSHLAYENTQF